METFPPTHQRFSRAGFTLLVCLIVISFSCKQDTTVGPTVQPGVDLRGVVPLTTGSVWHYMKINYSDSAPPDTVLDSIAVGDTTTLNGKLCHNMSGTAVAFPIANLIWMASVDASDFSIYVCVSCLASKTPLPQPSNQTGWETYHILKSPFSKGTPWMANDRDSTTGLFRVRTTDTTVTVRAGTFAHCTVLSRNYLASDDALILAIAPGVGIIKREYSSGFGGDVTELTGYELR